MPNYFILYFYYLKGTGYSPRPSLHLCMPRTPLESYVTDPFLVPSNTPKNEISTTSIAGRLQYFDLLNVCLFAL